MWCAFEILDNHGYCTWIRLKLSVTLPQRAQLNAKRHLICCLLLFHAPLSLASCGAYMLPHNWLLFASRLAVHVHFVRFSQLSGTSIIVILARKLAIKFVVLRKIQNRKQSFDNNDNNLEFHANFESITFHANRQNNNNNNKLPNEMLDQNFMFDCRIPNRVAAMLLMMIHPFAASHAISL